MKLYGLMIAKDDEAIIGDWCGTQLGFYDTVVCLDGSETDATERVLRSADDRIVYLHERDFCIRHKTDHGLRRVVHREIVRRFGTENWVMCCHPDEFCYHDPRKVAAKADREGYDLVSWFSLHFLPHPSAQTGWERRECLPVYERVRHYHWDYRGSGLPWREDRLYRNRPGVEWDETMHGSVRPHGVDREAPFHPILQHYKVFSTDLAWYETDGDHTLYRKHWPDQHHRTGLPFSVRRAEDLFVDSLPGYERCDRFDGRIDQPWNMGEEFRRGAVPVKRALR